MITPNVVFCDTNIFDCHQLKNMPDRWEKQPHQRGILFVNLGQSSGYAFCLTLTTLTANWGSYMGFPLNLTYQLVCAYDLIGILSEKGRIVSRFHVGD
jgi:hypothetical protein